VNGLLLTRLLVPAFLVLLILLSSGHQTQSLLAPYRFSQDPPPSPCTHIGVIAVDPPNNASFQLQQGSFVTFKANITNSCPITGFSVSLKYNSKVLKFSSLDQPAKVSGSYSGSVLGSQAQAQRICIDNAPIEGVCQDFDGFGIVSVALYLLAAQPTPDPTSGLLFQVTFQVVAVGYSQLHFLGQSVLSNAVTGSSVGFLPSDGYFTNESCPVSSSRLCTPPIVNFVSNSIPLYLNRPATFNSTGSRCTNQGCNIQSRTWEWGDTTLVQVNNVTTIVHNYSEHARPYTPTLTIEDSYGVLASKTILVNVISNWIELSVGGVSIDNLRQVYPGTVIHIRSNIVNNSSIAENATFFISLEDRVLSNRTLSLNPYPYGATGSLNATWDTTGYSPRVYRIDAYALPVYGQNSTKHIKVSSYVQLVIPLSTGTLSLSLFQTTGLGVVVLVAVAFLFSRLRKRPSWETEPL
jgi:hypothetical protein